MARYAIAQYRDDRCVGTPQRSRDLFASRAKKRGGCTIRSLGIPDGPSDEWAECLIDNRRTPVPDQVSFRLDFPRWLATQTTPNRRIVKRLSLRFSTAEVARKFRMSTSRVSQLRRQLACSSHVFVGQQCAAWRGSSCHPR